MKRNRPRHASSPSLGHRIVRLCLIGVAVAPVVLVVSWLLMETPEHRNSAVFQYRKLATFTAILSGFGLYSLRGSWRLAAFWRAFAVFLVTHTVVHIALLPYGQGWMDALPDLRLTRGRHPHDWLLLSMLAEAFALMFLCDHLGFSPGFQWRRTQRR